MIQIEYVNFLVDGVIDPSINLTVYLGFDEPYPMNINQLLWLMSGWSQRQFESNLLVYGRN